MDAMKPLQGKVAIVTGASGGIGVAIAKQLASAGASVAIAARREDKLAEVMAEIIKAGGTAISVKCDVTIRQQVKDLVARTEAELGPVDIMVNNAGVFYYTLMKNLHEDEWEHMIDVNCKGCVNGTGAVLTGMLQRGAGHIVNMSSDSGRMPFPGCCVYNGTKYFVEGLACSMRLELANTGIRITNIQPGETDTPIFHNGTDKEAVEKYAEYEKKQILQPDDVARAVMYAVTQPDYVAVNEVLIQPR